MGLLVRNARDHLETNDIDSKCEWRLRIRGEVNPILDEPLKKRSRNAIQIGAIIFLLIVLGAIIYLFMAGQ
jgi:hypothetical protein